MKGRSFQTSICSALTALWIAFAAGVSVAAEPHATNQPAELDMKKFQLAPGLKIELIASEPLLQNPVAFSVDERGRFFVVETHRYRNSIFDITEKTNWLTEDLSFRRVEDRSNFLARTFATNLSVLTTNSEIIRLVEDRDGDGRAETSSVFAGGFNQITSGTAAGVLARQGSVWVTSIPDLWRFREAVISKPVISNQSEFRPNTGTRVDEQLATGFGVHVGVSGHDVHGLKLGPDGRIYFSSGDRGFRVTTREGKLLDYPDTGAVLRCNPDGSDLEVFASGLRNPQELAFDSFGNLFTGDNDTAGEDPSRLIYVVEGGDYGWRCSYQHQPGFGPWVKEKIWAGDIDDVLPNAGLVAQGPAGLDFYPGTGMPERFKDHFLMCDFPGGIWSFTVKPKGAGYDLEKRDKFVWNCWPTDVEFARNGGVYFSDWVAGWGPPGKGRIYRLFDADVRLNPLVVETRKLLAESFETKSVAALLTLLGHADQRVRLEAQLALAANQHQQTGLALLQTARAGTNGMARIHAIWALTQMGRGSRPVPREFVELADDPLPEVRAQAAKMIGELRESSGYLKLIPLLRDPEPRVRFFAAIALGRLGDRKAMPAVLGMLRANAGGDPFLRHAGVFALERLADGRALAVLRRDPFLAVREAGLLALRRQRDPATAFFLGDRDARLIYEAARAVNDVPIPEGFPALARLLSDETITKAFVGHQAWLEATLSRAVNASFRVGTEAEVARLASFASNDTAPAAVRAEAIEALGYWAKPPPLDRVMGLWRPLAAREGAPARAAMVRILARCLRDDSEPVQRAAISSAAKLELREAGPAVFDLFQVAGTNVILRAEILATLSALKDSRLAKAVRLMLAEPNPALRREGLKWVGQTREPGAAAMLEQLLEGETDLRLNQTALAVLGTLTDPQADTVLARWMERLMAGKVKPQLQLDVLEAARQRMDGPIKVLLQRWEKSLGSADVLAGWRSALDGGDAAAGRRIFMERADVSCLRCHAVKGQGGNVGPALDHIGKARTRDYLLEAMVLPNKAIAPGFENVLVTMKNGANYAGLVKGETETELQLESPEDGPLKLVKADIASRQRGLSAMPEDLKQFLTPREVRDLVEFLAGLK